MKTENVAESHQTVRFPAGHETSSTWLRRWPCCQDIHVYERNSNRQNFGLLCNEALWCKTTHIQAIRETGVPKAQNRAMRATEWH